MTKINEQQPMYNFATYLVKRALREGKGCDQKLTELWNLINCEIMCEVQDTRKVLELLINNPISVDLVKEIIRIQNKRKIKDRFRIFIHEEGSEKPSLRVQQLGNGNIISAEKCNYVVSITEKKGEVEIHCWESVTM